MKHVAIVSFVAFATLASSAAAVQAASRPRDIMAVPAMSADAQQVWQDKPVSGSLTINHDGSMSFMGHTHLMTRSMAQQGVDEPEALKQFLLHISRLPRTALRHVAQQNDVNGHTHYYVQYVNDVPVEGTYAIGVAHDGMLLYAHQHIAAPPEVDTRPRITAEAAADLAIASAEGTAEAVALHDSQAPKLVIVYIDGRPHLAWRIGVKVRQPFESRAVYVNADTGDILTVQKTSHEDVAGHVRFSVERFCAGEKPQLMNMPHVQWSETLHTNSRGAFKSDKDVSRAKVTLKSPYVKITNEDGKLAGPWEYPLAAAPADNDIEISDAPLDQVDPFFHVLTVRSWLLSHVSKTTPLGRWARKQMRVNVNVPDTCNAYYDGDLNFFSEGDGCLNTGRTAGIVFHEYGHGIHEHAPPDDAWVPMDGQVSEGVGDFIAATITNNPNMRGVFSCHDNIRTCENEFTFCESGCDFDLYSEAHDAGQVMCGVWWELRQHMIKRYGKKKGAKETDKLHLRFLSLVGDMDSAYEAAIAADEDADHNPDNGTDHSCQINRAFASNAKGSVKHFPHLKHVVPCASKAND